MGSSNFGRTFGARSVLDDGRPATDVSNTSKYRGASLSCLTDLHPQSTVTRSASGSSWSDLTSEDDVRLVAM